MLKKTIKIKFTVYCHNRSVLVQKKVLCFKVDPTVLRGIDAPFKQNDDLSNNIKMIQNI